MKIDELNGEQYQSAIKRVVLELKAIGIELDPNNALDRTRAWVLACNLRIEFNERGGLK